MRGKLFLICGLALMVLFTGCVKDDDVIDISNSGENAVSEDTIKINKFIYNCVQDYYLWEGKTDWGLYANTYSTYSDPYKLFDKFVYTYDYWSDLYNNIGEVEDEFNGTSTTFGYYPKFFLYSNSDDKVFAVVLYTYPGSPAEKAGLKRGDLIVKMNGSYITTSNYKDLVYASSLNLNLGIDNGTSISVDTTKTISMTAVSMTENPINKDSVIVKGSNRIGYLHYTGYLMDYETDLINVFKDFKSQGVTDVVLDLRYNGGGFSRTAQILSSILAPSSAVKGKSVYLTQQWNDALTQYYKKKGEDLNEYFLDTLAVNMNLSRLYVLVSGNTASASEATIIGLKPYMNVVMIGDTTSGKYCGGYLLSTEDYYSRKSDYEGITNWGIYIMVYRFANSAGYTSFVDGIAPNYLVNEDYLALYPFGDERDPLLGTALEQITGEKYVTTESLKLKSQQQKKMLPDIHDLRFGKMIETRSAPPMIEKINE